MAERDVDPAVDRRRLRNILRRTRELLGIIQATAAHEMSWSVSKLIRIETGVVTISFDYINGVVSNVHIDKGSGSRPLDRSAMAAVQKAQLPPKPAELAGVNHFVIQLNYNLGG